MKRRHLLSLILFPALGLLASIPMSAPAANQLHERHEVPPAKPMLVVSGKISKVNAGNADAGQRYEMDMDMLEKLPQHSFRTGTPWYAETREYTGPLLRDVLSAAGAHGQTLTAYALNDYKVEIPLRDAANYHVIIARLMDGKPMPVRDKGPLFIIYPFDDHSELRTQTYYGRSVWQLREIRVK